MAAPFFHKIVHTLGCCMVAATFITIATAQPPKPSGPVVTRILFLLDGSGSMMNKWGSQVKINVARNILSEIVDSLDNVNNVELALRAYGHISPKGLRDCKDTRLEVNFGRKNATFIKNKLKMIHPKGTTPIAYSLEQAARDFTKRANTRNIIILITDGEESCEGDPCAISKEMQRHNIFLKPFIIGLGLELETKEAFECMGSFYNAASASDFQMIMKNVIKRVVNRTSIKVNLLDIYGKATETNANMTFYDNVSGLARYNYYHTQNQRGESDTLSLDPVNTYDITVQTIPPVTEKNIELKPEESNIVNIPTPQGFLELKLQGETVFDNANKKIKALVRKKDAFRTTFVQEFDTREKYLVGNYDLVFLTLPRIKMENISIGQSRTTTLQIATPGVLTVVKNYEGYGGIFEEKDNKLRKIHALNVQSRKETLVLQPGHYRLIFRPKYMKKTSTTVDKVFEIKSATSITIKL